MMLSHNELTMAKNLRKRMKEPDEPTIQIICCECNSVGKFEIIDARRVSYWYCPDHYINFIDRTNVCESGSL